MRFSRGSRSLLFLPLLCIGFILGFFAAQTSSNRFILASQTTLPPATKNASLTELVQVSSPGVVSISATTGDEKVFGTGFVVAAQGTIITCAHVVKDTAASYSITTQDNKTYPVTVVSRHPKEDIAVLKASGVTLQSLPLGDSNALHIGDQIIAIGNPFGVLDGTVTTGIVSGMHRTIIAADQESKYQEGLQDVIQTDASLNPGESGGPLLNMAGQVVGINAASDTRAQNISFAIPSNSIKQLLVLDGIRSFLPL